MLREWIALTSRLPVSRLLSAAAGPLALIWPGRATANPAEGDGAAPPKPNEAAEATPGPLVASEAHPSPAVVTGVTVRGASPSSRALRGALPVRVIELEESRLDSGDAGTLLARDGAATFRSTGALGAFSRVNLDGLGGDRVRLFLDGIPLSLAGFGLGLGSVPVGMLKRVELHLGVMPIRYGADALGGGVDLVTDTEFTGTRAGASYQAGSFGTGRIVALGSHRGEDSGLFARVHAFLDHSKNDYSMPAQVTDEAGQPSIAAVRRLHDAYSARGAGVQAGIVDRPFAKRLLGTIFHNEFEKEIQNNVVQAVPYGEVRYEKQASGGNVRYSHDLGGDVQLAATAGLAQETTRFEDLGRCVYDWDRRCVFEFTPPQRGEIDARPSDQTVRDRTLFARALLSTAPAEGHHLRFSLAQTVVSRSGEDRVLGPGAFDPLKSGRSVVQLVPGVEHRAESDDKVIENVVFGKFYFQRSRAEQLQSNGDVGRVDTSNGVPGLGEALRVNLTRDLFAKASYEWATRLPSVDELFGDGVLVLQSPSLSAERSHNLNLSLAYDAALAGVGAVSAEVRGYGRLANDLIVLRGYDSYYQNENVLTARALGVNARAQWTSPEELLTLRAYLNYEDTRNTSETGPAAPYRGDRIPNQPWLFAGASGRLTFRDYIGRGTALRLGWYTRYVHAFYRSWESAGLGSTKQEVPSQLLHDVTLTHAFRQKELLVAMSVEVTNVTDEPSFDYFGQRRPGRAVFGKASIELH